MAAKRKQLAKWQRAPEGGKASVEFANGHKRVFTLAEIPEALTETVLWYGLKQKLADSGSDAETVADFEVAVAGTWERIQDGIWAAGGGGSNTFIEALAQIKGVTVEQVKAAVDKANEEQLAKWKANPQVKAKVAEITAERAKQRAATAEAEEIEIDFAD